jgi:GGDEF domain-containing protein
VTAARVRGNSPRVRPREWQSAGVSLSSSALPALAAGGSGLAAAVGALVSVGTGSSVPAVIALVVCAAGAAVASAGWRRAEEHARFESGSAREKARVLSVRDELTGCLNARGLGLLGEQILATVRRQGDSMHACVVEVGGLESVVGVTGELGRQEVLVAVADALRAGTRGTDVVARWDETTFVVLGPGSGTSPAELERRLRVHLVAAPPAPLHLWPCRVAVGAAVLEPWDSGDVPHLVDSARTDLGLRAALRAPSAPEPRHRLDHEA